jgi:hypothetical protein
MSKVEKGKKEKKSGKRLFGPKTGGWMDAQTAWIRVFGRCLVFGLTEQVIRVVRARRRPGAASSASAVEKISAEIKPNAATGQGRVRSVATWWTDTAVHRMCRKFPSFEKQSKNQTGRMYEYDRLRTVPFRMYKTKLAILSYIT